MTPALEALTKALHGAGFVVDDLTEAAKHNMLATCLRGHAIELQYDIQRLIDAMTPASATPCADAVRAAVAD